MDLDNKIDSIYGKSPAINGYRVKNIPEVKNNGYLVCHSCKGYYELNDNESIEDFYGCECGNPLTYHENIADLFKNPKTSNFNKNYDEIIAEYDEYAELQEIVNILRNKATERKQFLEKLCERVMIQEEVLNEIKYDRIHEIDDEHKSVWDLMEEKNLKSEINGQKKLINNILQQENKFLSHVYDKRNKTRKSIAGEIFTTSLPKISILTLSVIFIALLLIYFLK